MTDEPCAEANAAWLALMSETSDWFGSFPGRQLLEHEQHVLAQELERFFGSYLVHYGPFADATIEPQKLKRSVRLGPPLPGVEIVCEEQSWPIGEHAADVVVVQHGLDFSLSPHALLREAARSVRPGGHLLIVGVNPWSAWGASHLLSRKVFRQARCIRPARVSDWLNLLGFALEKRRYGCYCPPLSSSQWQARLSGLETIGQRLQAPAGGFYLLVARKLMVGLRPLREQRREPMGQLLPMPVAKVSRRDAKH
ncbi:MULTISPECIES: methyltransferase domain-containing protein [Pseudomonadaceae]|uniref:SAM-dependent methyltransferase n=1 Tax=Pseudomonas saudiphocaensis TaxID=1499686 RepID=A0A078LSY9_9PSED|nr:MULTISPECIES: methyltransferase domain-containing protein [Pseudomonadaceae]MCF6780971.1 class I SAM-dependent methyltransferase [Stutzerimonas stutzeri]MCF6803539.1 class I SAM-dependent methyltransferase [Stutzerimonas stutzeri]RRV17006.1 methyltransferase domain-containing protein [Pseudomonas saudiphocaensis]CDZ93437.1 SAM-dependent methyltransferase [Pseudomonas saudiphocaensis]